MKRKGLIYFLFGIACTVWVGLLILPNVKEVQISSVLEDSKVYMYGGGAEGLYLGDGVILCKYNEGACIHEVGHRLDEGGGKISETAEFRGTLDAFIVWCESMEDVWGEKEFYCNIARFSGINGNPLNGWGGYGEAYAEMYKYNRQLNFEIPEILKRFFEFEI